MWVTGNLPTYPKRDETQTLQTVLKKRKEESVQSPWQESNLHTDRNVIHRVKLGDFKLVVLTSALRTRRLSSGGMELARSTGSIQKSIDLVIEADIILFI